MLETIRRLLLPMLFSFASAAGATPIQFNFTGTVTDDAINGCGGLVACGAVTGSYVFDNAAPDGNAAADAGLYAATSIAFSIDGSLFFSAANGVINVANFAAVDQYGLLALGGNASNGSAADLSMLLQDFTGTAFSGDALPLTPSILASLLPGGFTLNASDESFQLLGLITSISCNGNCGGTSTISEPPLLLLFTAGLVFACLRRRAHQPILRMSLTS